MPGNLQRDPPADHQRLLHAAASALRKVYSDHRPWHRVQVDFIALQSGNVRVAGLEATPVLGHALDTELDTQAVRDIEHALTALRVASGRDPWSKGRLLVERVVPQDTEPVEALDWTRWAIVAEIHLADREE